MDCKLKEWLIRKFSVYWINNLLGYKIEVIDLVSDSIIEKAFL
jgi:hypothetical protein